MTPFKRWARAGDRRRTIVYNDLAEALVNHGLAVEYDLQGRCAWTRASILRALNGLRGYRDGRISRFDVAERYHEYAALLARGPGSPELAAELVLRRLSGIPPAAEEELL